MELDGSSPRGRGKRLVARVVCRYPGLIPAQAGKTPSPAISASTASAHPRAGGENSTVERLSLSYSGSSPRGRGKRARIVGRSAGVRLIPARAGKTRRAMKRALPSRAHPRAGGENSSVLIVFVKVSGSSPRGRGKRPTRMGRPSGRRLIPARAGKTGSFPVAADASSAHPRAGGENSIPAKFSVSANGSSPRGRGKRPREASFPVGGGLIPARAGKTILEAGRCTRIEAHPRAGGENRSATSSR